MRHKHGGGAGWDGEGRVKRGGGRGGSGGLLTEWEVPFKRDRVGERFEPTSDLPVGGILKNFPGSR